MRKRQFQEFLRERFLRRSGRTPKPQEAPKIEVSHHHFFLPIGEHETARRCHVCPMGAEFWRYKSDRRGGMDKSSRVAVCGEHRG